MQTLKFRQLTNSPAEEYAARPGQAYPLPHAIAALMLHSSKTVTPSAHGVEIKDVRLGKLVYWHPDSITCSNLGVSRMPKVVVTWCQDDPSIAHILSLSGKYIETLPQKLRADALGKSATNAEAYAGAKRAQNRAANHLANLHRSDIAEAVDTALANAASLQRAITTLPVATTPDAAPAVPVNRAASQAIAAGTRIQAEQADLRAARAMADDALDTFAARGTTPAVAARRQLVPAAASPAFIDPFDLD